jgi:hypothetical protein
MKGLICLLFLFQSCTHFAHKKQPIDKQTLSKNLAKYCTHTSGKGELISQNETYRFFYENLLDPRKREWILAVEIPLKGEEEILSIWSEQNKFVFKGSFYKRIKAQFKYWKKNLKDPSVKIKDVKKLLKLLVEGHLLIHELQTSEAKRINDLYQSCHEQAVSCLVKLKKYELTFSEGELNLKSNYKNYEINIEIEVGKQEFFKEEAMSISFKGKDLLGFRLRPSVCEKQG